MLLLLLPLLLLLRFCYCCCYCYISCRCCCYYCSCCVSLQHKTSSNNDRRRTKTKMRPLTPNHAVRCTILLSTSLKKKKLKHSCTFHNSFVYSWYVSMSENDRTQTYSYNSGRAQAAHITIYFVRGTGTYSPGEGCESTRPCALAQ